MISMQQITDDVNDLPSLPAVVMELLNSVDRDDVDIHALAQQVTHDLALTAKTLRIANSAYYTTLVKVTTIQQAISLMGMTTVRQIILTAAVTGCFPDNKCPGFSHKDFWQHANAVAIIARILARRLNFSQDIAFTAGLLHDIGTLVLVAYHPERYAAVIAWQNEHQSTQPEAEKEVLGLDHAAVGHALAECWNFSDAIKNAIGGHHQPDRPGLGFLATIIHVANGIAHVLNVTATPDHSTPEISALSWESLGLDQNGLDQVLEEAAREFSKLRQQVDL